MTSYVAARLFLAALTVLGVVTIVFIALRMIPGDPAALVAGIQASPAQIQDIRRQLGLDHPAPIQYARYIAGLLSGDLGDSSVTGQPVLAEIAARFPYTVQLTVLAILMSTFIGIGFGTIAAARRNSWIDVGISTVAVLGISMPVYWLGLMLIIVFSVNLRVLPAGGSREVTSIVLPALALAAFSTGLIARMTRASILDELGEDYVRTAKAKGATYVRQLVRHALRNALLPVITVIGLQVGQLLGGAVLTETVFSWPGMGRLLVSSILNRDYAVVQGIVLLFAVGFVLVNLVVDLVYGLADPRIRFGTR
jgi:peptide/nickel transport system permease protein